MHRTFSRAPMHARRAREAMGGHGLGNFRAGDYHWDTLGKQRETIHYSTCSGAPMHARRARETMGNNGFGNFRAGDHHWDRLGKQWETIHMQLIGDNFEGGDYFANT